MKHLMFIYAIVFCSFCFSQNAGVPPEYVGTRYIKTVDNADKTVIGSPYVNETFVVAKISLNNNLVILVRYNAVNDEMEVKEDGDRIFNLNKSLEDLTVFLVNEKKTYQAFNFTSANDNNESRGYFVHIGNQNNGIKLLKKEVIEFQQEKKATSGYDRGKPAQFKRKSDTYYIKIGNGPVQPLSNNKNDFIELFPSSKSKVLDYIKSEKIKLNNDDDFLKLATFLNSIK